MRFQELDNRMRVFETAHDYSVLPGIYMVARLDGRNFTRLTKEKHHFQAPYDAVFRDYMVATAAHLMNCGFKVTYAHTHSDEISLLFHQNEQAFNRKLRKYNSILAGEASAKFSLLIGDLASFDCRISELPNAAFVIDYFRWRSEDAGRNALNSHCYWALRSGGYDSETAASTLRGLSVAEKNELLFQYGVNYNDFPAWHKRGVGLYWEIHVKSGIDPRTGEKVRTERKRIKIDMELPTKEAYSGFIREFLD